MFSYWRPCRRHEHEATSRFCVPRQAERTAAARDVLISDTEPVAGAVG